MENMKSLRTVVAWSEPWPEATVQAEPLCQTASVIPYLVDFNYAAHLTKKQKKNQQILILYALWYVQYTVQNPGTGRWRGITLFYCGMILICFNWLLLVYLALGNWALSRGIFWPATNQLLQSHFSILCIIADVQCQRLQRLMEVYNVFGVKESKKLFPTAESGFQITHDWAGDHEQNETDINDGRPITDYT